MVCKYPEGSLCSSFPVLKQLNNWNPLVSDCKDDYFEKILAGKVWYELPVKFKVLVTLESLQQRGSRYMAAIAEQNHLMLSELYTCVLIDFISPADKLFQLKRMEPSRILMRSLGVVVDIPIYHTGIYGIGILHQNCLMDITQSGLIPRVCLIFFSARS